MQSTNPIVNTEVSTQDKARLLMSNHQRHLKTRQQAMLSRAAAEVGQ
ncbi:MULTISPECIES: hypothetical protein [Microseira]|uniref:Glutamine synthetase inactivating factor IF7 n=1 Tax=Microseira wollei NIES-4236 TaxID=2530354 RepID=A0AAV3X0X3_9CYAN|nr:hypothetical protein [Microseira wollei]GET35629.1 hypothetical protein MiSe_03710 [Microseira wollei NIES-4236]